MENTLEETTPKTIRVVDDDQQGQLFYGQELGDAGYRVLRAPDGEEALRILEKQVPDLVILDLNLPGMNGLEVLSCIGIAYPHLPIILYTAYGAYKEDFISWAADAYVLKSSDLTELKARIEQVLRERPANVSTGHYTETAVKIRLPIRKILCPVDFSPPSREALKTAAEWATHCEATLLVLHAQPYFQLSPHPLREAIHALETDQARCDAALKELTKMLQECLPSSARTRSMVRMGDAVHAITRTASKENVDLIIMGTHGHTGWKHLVLGSVAERVVRTSPCPVLTIPGRAKAKNPAISQLPMQAVGSAGREIAAA